MRNIRQRNLFTLLLLISDAIFIYVSFVLAYSLRFDFPLVPVTKGIPSFSLYKGILPMIIVIWLLNYAHSGFYGRQRLKDIYDELFHIIRANTVGSVIVMVLTFMYRDFSYSRLVLVYAWAVSCVLVFLAREIIKSAERELNRIHGVKVRVLLVGKGKFFKDIMLTMKKKKSRIELFTLDAIEKPDNNFKAFLGQNKIDEIVIADSPGEHSGMMELIDVCEKGGVTVRILPDILELRMSNIFLADYYGLPVFQVRPVKLAKFNYFMKRMFDVILSILVISVLLIPLSIIAIIIKLDSKGPVFHLQSRMGYRGRSFPFVKFRSMVLNADDLLKDLIHMSERQGPVFKMKNDPRITRIGSFIRRYSIDEIPQFINVLRGEMSVVGPRPQVLWEASHYDEWAKKRLKVLPGITGYWQISGRSNLSYEEMIKLDIYYTENWSFELDFKIIMKTMPAIFSKYGAY